MKKRYIIWKDPACNGRDVEWIEIDGKQFAEMMKLPENRKRHFLRFTGEPYGEAETLLIEATEEQYRAWKRSTTPRAIVRKGTKGLRCFLWIILLV